MKFRVFNPSVDYDKYLIASYYLESSTTLRDAAWDIAIGQSVGNPNVRSVWETEQLYESHCCVILADEADLAKQSKGNVSIAFPLANLNITKDGISQLMAHLMGGHLDIDRIQKCHLTDIQLPAKLIVEEFYRPKFGISGIRNFTKCHDKPLLGGIVKPKTGINVDTLVDIVKEMVDGGVNFIKEDEIMSNPRICPLDKRVAAVMKYLDGKDVIYATCITGDYPYVLDRVKLVHELGCNAIHINIWSGLGIYKAIRALDLPMFLFFQKSGDKIMTKPSHDFHVSWPVICKLAGLMGVDFIHAGMWGGYMSDNTDELSKVLDVLHTHDVMPSLSCGMHPGLVQAINTRFGIDYMANCGGAIHGHPSGTKAGAMAMRQAIAGDVDGEEYQQAIDKWGLVK